MASVSLVESAKLTQDTLVRGVIANIVTTNPIFQLMPFDEIDGPAIVYNRENVLGDAQVLGVGGTITAKNPTTFTQVTTPLKRFIGQAETDNFIEATSSTQTDQRTAQIAGKSKSVGRMYQDQMVNGDGTGDNMEGLLSLASAGQTVVAGVNGANVSFDLLEQLKDLVKSKDGQVDFMMAHSRTIRSIKALLRGQSGAGIVETLNLPSGQKPILFDGIPIFRNDWLPIDQTVGTGTGCTTIVAGCFDDGTRKVGIAGLWPMGHRGIQVKEVGELEDRDETADRVKLYAGLASFSDLGLAIATGVLN